MKIFFDIFLVFITMPLWLTLMILIAIAVRIFQGAPIFFRQARAGKNGRQFMFIKFRTMRDGNEPDIERLTKIGKFLRRTSLDELPQLFHVLMGQMSLVGPRPLPIRYLPRYSKEQSRRHEVRPGITGWAQVNGRNTISWDEKFRLDVWYVDNHNLFLDIKILWRTIFRTASQEGINADANETMSEFLGTTGTEKE